MVGTEYLKLSCLPDDQSETKQNHKQCLVESSGPQFDSTKEIAD